MSSLAGKIPTWLWWTGGLLGVAGVGVLAWQLTTAASRPNPASIVDIDDAFTGGYIEKALDDTYAEGGGRHTFQELSPDTVAQMLADCERFQREQARDLARSGLSDQMAGGKFWDARSGGSGFLDRDPGMVEYRLQRAAEAYGEFDVVILGEDVARSRDNPTPDLDAFTKAYIDEALWLSCDEYLPSGRPKRVEYTLEDLHPATLEKMVSDAAAFQAAHADDLAVNTPELGGRDFWRSRSDCGSGFWDGDWPEPQATRLSDMALEFGSAYLYFGDDGKLRGA